MFKFAKNLVATAVLAAACAGSANAAPVYSYVGSWFVDQGPYWAAQNANNQFTTPVYSGVEAAAVIFGGNASDYVTSTVSANVADINFSAWMDGWGDSFTYGHSGNPASGTLHIDVGNDGLYATPFGTGLAYSAYVSDHGLHLQNFAFRVTNGNNVPEPASLALLGLGLAGFAVTRRKRKE